MYRLCKCVGRKHHSWTAHATAAASHHTSRPFEWQRAGRLYFHFEALLSLSLDRVTQAGHPRLSHHPHTSPIVCYPPETGPVCVAAELVIVITTIFGTVKNSHMFVTIVTRGWISRVGQVGPVREISCFLTPAKAVAVSAIVLADVAVAIAECTRAGSSDPRSMQ